MKCKRVIALSMAFVMSMSVLILPISAAPIDTELSGL